MEGKHSKNYNVNEQYNSFDENELPKAFRKDNVENTEGEKVKMPKKQ